MERVANKILILLFLALFCGPLLAQDMGCSLQAEGADIRFDPITMHDLQRTDFGHFQITCADGLAYSLEVAYAQPGGVVELVGAATSNTVPVYLTDASTNQPVGQASFGEAIQGMGTGSPQSISIKATVRPATIPIADNYEAVGRFVLLF